MAVARTILAVERLKAALIADAALAEYVDSVTVKDRARADELPDFERHAIVLIPGAKSATGITPATNLETFTVALRLLIVVWDPADDEAITLAHDPTPGPGRAEVGMLQFVEDVSNALRKHGLPDGDGFDLCLKTGVECDQMPSLMTVKSEDRDTLIYEEFLTWTGEWQGYHDPDLREAP